MNLLACNALTEYYLWTSKVFLFNTPAFASLWTLTDTEVPRLSFFFFFFCMHDCKSRHSFAFCLMTPTEWALVWSFAWLVKNIAQHLPALHWRSKRKKIRKTVIKLALCRCFLYAYCQYFSYYKHRTNSSKPLISAFVRQMMLTV